MDFVLFSAVFPPEPVVSAKLSFDIASALSKKNSVTVIAPEPSRPFGFQFIGESLKFNFEYIQANSFICASSSLTGRFRESYSFGRNSYKYIADNHKDIDVIYANTWPLMAQYLTVKAAKKFNIPIVMHVQDIYPESISQKLSIASSFVTRILLPIDKYILSNSSKVIAISKKMKEYLAHSRNIDPDKIVVVPNWQDEESFEKVYNQTALSDERMFTFMYLGNIGPVAGVELLIKSFVLANIKNSRLVIAGSGSMKESLINQAERFKDSIIEFWPVPNGKVPEIQNTATVFILPIKKGSASTSIPSKLPAYMFSAKPIIACVDHDSDTYVAVKEANCGWVIEPENIEMLSATMKEAVSISEEKRSLFGENGRKYALANYSKKNNLQKLVSIITDTITS
jgi:glycosyltransferase involved in cell wall biosynthesis